MARQSWLDDSQTPQIDQYTQQLTSFIDALSDGQIDDEEMKSQEKRLVAAMQDVESKLDDTLHAKVTQLLCELTAYNLMQTLQSFNDARPKTAFRG
jgi:regulator of sigma D